jgi:hypothetical protein
MMPVSCKVCATLQAVAKFCPGCTTPIERTQGCNKMTCRVCQAYWCWRCGQLIEGYSHFAKSTCVMFDLEEIARFDAEMEAQPQRCVTFWHCEHAPYTPNVCVNLLTIAEDS